MRRQTRQMPPRKPPKRKPDKKTTNKQATAGGGVPISAAGKYFQDHFEDNECDAWYRGPMTPLEFFLAVLNDERQPIAVRYTAARDAAPYIHSKAAQKPYIPSDEEKRQLEESQRLVIEIVDFKEVD